MSNAWFRFYHEVLDDPKVQMLPPADFKAWVNLLCLAARSEGVLPDTAATAFALRMDETGVATLIERFVIAGLIDKLNGGLNGYRYAPHGWTKRQFKSDTSSERVKRYRENKKRSSVTPPETETETEETEANASAANCGAGDQSTEMKPQSVAKHNLPVDQAFRDWAVAARQTGWAVPRALTDQRRKKLAARLREHGLPGWRDALTKACASRMLGHDPPSWFDFDFITRNPENILKLLEGKYDGPFASHQSGSGRNGGTDGFDDAIQRLARGETGHPYADHGSGMPRIEGMG